MKNRTGLIALALVVAVLVPTSLFYLGQRPTRPVDHPTSRYVETHGVVDSFGGTFIASGLPRRIRAGAIVAKCQLIRSQFEFRLDGTFRFEKSVEPDPGARPEDLSWYSDDVKNSEVKEGFYRIEGRRLDLEWPDGIFPETVMLSPDQHSFQHALSGYGALQYVKQ